MISDDFLARWEAMSQAGVSGAMEPGDIGELVRMAIPDLIAEVRQMRAVHLLIAECDAFAFSIEATFTDEGYPGLALNMNDVFVSAADAEEIALGDAPALAAILKAEGHAGLVRWVAAKRGCPIPERYQRKDAP